MNITVEGKEYLFVGYGILGIPGATHFLTSSGALARILPNTTFGDGFFALFREIPKLHIFGGAIFAEDGPPRIPVEGEWIILNDTIILVKHKHYRPNQVVRLVARASDPLTEGEAS